MIPYGIASMVGQYGNYRCARCRCSRVDNCEYGKDYRMCTATKNSGWMGYQTRLKKGYICGKWGIATFWGKSV